MGRNIVRCPTRSCVELDQVDELNLVDGWTPLIPGSEFKSFAAMREAWFRHRDELLPHYLAQRPGTRPYAMWALGELPLPPPKNEPREASPRVTIDGKTLYAKWVYFGSATGENGWYLGGSDWGEFEHLRAAGVVDGAEARRALRWVDDRYYRPGRERRSYESLVFGRLTENA